MMIGTYLSFLILHLDIVDDILVAKEQDKNKGNKKGTDEYDGGDPGLNIKGKV